MDAVLTIAADDGLDQVSLRNVARHAGVSMGMVQHHFGSTSSMLRASLARAIDAIDRRIEAEIGAAPQSEGPQTVLKVTALAYLSDDPIVVPLVRALAQFKSNTARDPATAATIAAYEQRHIAALAASLQEAKRRRLLHRLVEPEAEAEVFWTLLQSVATEVAIGGRDRDEAIDLMRYHFRRLARSARVTRPR